MNTDRIQRLQSLLDRIKHNAALPKAALGKGLVLGGTATPRSDVSAGPAVPATRQHSVTPTRTGMPAQHAVQPAQTAPVPQIRSIKKTQPMQLSPSAQPTPASPQARADQTPVSGRAAPVASPPIAQPSAPAHAAPSAPRAAPSAPGHAAPTPATPAAAAQQPSAPANPAPSAPAHTPPATPAFQVQPAAAASSGTSNATMQAVHSPLVAVPSISATMVDGRRARARVPTVIGVAPNPSSPKPEPTAPHREPAPSVNFEEVDAEELDADEVLDAVSSLPPPPERAVAESAATPSGVSAAKPEPRASQAEIDNLSWSEPPIDVELPPPDSSPRPRVAGSIDEALSDAATDSEVEVPIKTPPPESGRQPTEGVYAAPMASPAVPTAEQLGDTVELEAPTAAELELDLTHRKPDHTREELELELPKQPSVLEPISAQEPPHRAPEASQVVEIPEEADTAIMSAAKRGEDAEALELRPEVTKRHKAEQAKTVELLTAARAFAPGSFLELLDASLKLGGK